jgi:hypothetical protein
VAAVGTDADAGTNSRSAPIALSREHEAGGGVDRPH